jgi:hypothetical protein
MLSKYLLPGIKPLRLSTSPRTMLRTDELLLRLSSIDERRM